MTEKVALYGPRQWGRWGAIIPLYKFILNISRAHVLHTVEMYIFYSHGHGQGKMAR